jgi:hypothetical protein
MAKLGINLKDGDGNFLYPRTFVEMIVRHSSNESLATILGNLSKDVVQAKADVDTFLSDFSLSKEVRTALIELRDYLESDDGKITEQLLSTINDLKDNAVKCPDYNSGEYIGTLTHGGTVLYPFTRDDLVFINSIPDYASLDSLLPRILTRDAQTLSLEDKQQARQNIDAAGVSATYGEGLATISFNGNAIYPETKGSQVKLSIGGNAEDAIKANGGNIEKERVRAIAREDEIAETLAETKEKVDTFLADADTSAEAIDKLKELQDYIKNDETSASQMLGDIAQNKQDIADNATNIEKEVTRAKQTEMYLESQKANKSGYYENLSVGVADNLSGRGEATESEFAMRPSGGENKSIPEDGIARINVIKGNSVAYNQCAKDPLFETENSSNWLYRGYSSYNVSNGTVEIISNGTDECYIDQFFNFAKEHVYLFICDVKGGGQQSGIRVYYEGVSRAIYANVNKLNTWERLHVFVKTPVEETGGSRIRLYCAGNSGSVTSYFRKPRLIDLTKMFNGVNVPTTVEEFEALYGNMPNEYNEGTIIDNHTSAIKSVGVNAWDEEITFATIGIESGNASSDPERIASKNFCACIGGAKYYVSKPSNVELNLLWYDKDKNYISFNYSYSDNEFTAPTNARFFKINLYNTYGTTYNHDICIHLVHTGYLNGRYFPYESQTRQLPTVEGGLKSAGSAYDEIRYNKSKDKWEHIQRVGSVDLGTLGYEAIGGSVFMSENIHDRAFLETFNAISNKYIVLKETATSSIGVVNSTKDKYIQAYYIFDNIAPVIYVKDSAYTDVATFKQAMQGVILYYELAKPKVKELDVDISPDYKVWDYGTEEAISEVLSTPVRINANYGFNAVGQITDNTELIKELLARVAVLEAEVAQANSVNTEPIVE